jgi:molybdate transport system substrate-binding protein
LTFPPDDPRRGASTEPRREQDEKGRRGRRRARKARRFRAGALACALLAGAACEEAPRVQVAAAVSLRDALREMGETPPDAEPRFHFAASGVLMSQALEGAPFDLVVLAGGEEMDRLAAAGRIEPGSRAVIATNRLVLAVPAWRKRAASLADLARPAFARIAIGSPATVPAGRYAAQALRAAGLWRELEGRLVFAGHARQVVQYLERGEVDAGIVYRSDVEGAAGIEVCAEVDAALHEPIRYEAAILRDAADPAGARRFLERLRGERGAVALRRHGFGPPP